jgi:hypothetical protein
LILVLLKIDVAYFFSFQRTFPHTLKLEPSEAFFKAGFLAEDYTSLR